MYETEFQVQNSQQYSFINLGDVNHGVTELWLNGEYLGLKWYGERIYDVGTVLNNGTNTLMLKIVTVLGNYMKSLNDNQVAMR
jgi:hypothetical protein